MSTVRIRKIYLVRHGATPELELRQLQGQRRDSGLSAPGRQQVEALAVTMKEVPFNFLYSSDLVRARETAAILSNGRPVQPQVDGRLREFDFGAWEGMTLAEIQNRWPDEKLEPYSVPWHAALYGGETIDSLHRRADSFFRQLADQHDEDNVVIVAHAQVLSALLCAALELPIGQTWRFGIGPASLSTLLLLADGTAHLHRLNQTS